MKARNKNRATLFVVMAIAIMPIFKFTHRTPLNKYIERPMLKSISEGEGKVTSEGQSIVISEEKVKAQSTLKRERKINSKSKGQNETTPVQNESFEAALVEAEPIEAVPGESNIQIVLEGVEEMKNIEAAPVETDPIGVSPVISDGKVLEGEEEVKSVMEIGRMITLEKWTQGCYGNDEDTGSLCAYTGPEEYVPFQNDSIRMPLPIQVIEQYKKWHSVQALEKDPHNRKFALGLCTCPHSAGNRMHMFLNNLLEAVLTNRTLLWKYFDATTCDNMQYLQRKIHCRKVNKVEDCDKILQRASWIPSADEWSERLDLGKPVMVKRNANVRDPFVVFPNKACQNSFHEGGPVEESSAAKKLLSLGADFLYGMLYRYSFDFSDRIKESTPAPKHPMHKSYSMAIHSRHPDNVDGCAVEKDIVALNFFHHKAHNMGIQACTVAILTDRTCTLEKISKWADNVGCTPIFVKDYVSDGTLGNGTFEEHGPFAGVGFFQDLFLASKVTSDAIVGTESHEISLRSSSQLLVELVEFHRRMEALQNGYDPSNIRKLHVYAKPL